jgi:hypothetical protein
MTKIKIQVKFELIAKPNLNTENRAKNDFSANFLITMQ